MSSSNPYQSRLVKFVVQQTRQLRDRSLQTWRQLRLGTLWGAQIALYPIYAAFQATRLVGRQLRQVVRQATPRLKAAQRAIQTVSRAPAATPAVPVDTPVQQTLAIVQAFSLPVDLPCPQPLSPERRESTLPSQPFSLTGKGLRSSLAVLWQRLMAESVVDPMLSHSSALVRVIAPTLQATPDQLATVQGDSIRGIATLLSTRKLVLVTGQNSILDILTPEQDDYLRRCIIGAIAAYLRQWRRLAPLQPLPLSPLPLTANRPNALPPVRLFYTMMRWMQLSSVAIAVNLFHEAEAIAAMQHQIRLSREFPFDPAIATDPWQDETSMLPSLAQFLQFSPLRRSPQASTHATPLQLPSRSTTALPSRPAVPLLANAQRSHAAQIIPVGTAAIQPVKPRSPSQPVRSPSEGLATAQPIALSPSPQPLPPFVEPSHGASIPSVDEQTQPMNLATQDSTLQHTALNAPTTEELQPTSSPEAIDTQATLVEYVKHPLQQVLEWIDLGMLWLEKRVMQLVNWLRRS